MRACDATTMLTQQHIQPGHGRSHESAQLPTAVSAAVVRMRQQAGPSGGAAVAVPVFSTAVALEAEVQHSARTASGSTSAVALAMMVEVTVAAATTEASRRRAWQPNELAARCILYAVPLAISTVALTWDSACHGTAVVVCGSEMN